MDQSMSVKMRQTTSWMQYQHAVCNRDFPINRCRIEQALACTPMLLDVVSKQLATVGSNGICQSVKAVTVACTICSPVPLANFGTASSFSISLPITSTGSRSTWFSKVGSSIPSQFTLSELVGLKFPSSALLQYHDSQFELGTWFHVMLNIVIHQYRIRGQLW